MTPWNLINASMQIAARCSEVFSKQFVYRVTRFTALWIDATPIFNPSEAPYNIHMVAERNSNCLEVYLNFGKYLNLDWFEKETMDHLAYLIGHDIASRYSIVEGNRGFLFYFDNDLYYQEYEDHYEFNLNGEKKVVDTDFPLLHYMQTEFDVEFLMFKEMGLKGGLSNISKNGKSIFNMLNFKNQSSWEIVRIEKKDNQYIVSIEEHHFSCKNETMSYIGQLSILEKIPTLPVQNGENPYMEIYFSKTHSLGNAVKIERLRNYGLTPDDIKASIPLLCEKLMLSSSHDWANHINF